MKLNKLIKVREYVFKMNDLLIGTYLAPTESVVKFIAEVFEKSLNILELTKMSEH